MKRIVALLLILVMIVPVYAEGDMERVEEKFKDLKEGQVVTVYFNKDVPEESMQLDGFKFLGKEENIYSFEVLRDMEEATIVLEYKKSSGEEEVEVDGGEGNNSGIGGGEGGAIDWSDFALGKFSWTYPDSVDTQFAIRLDASKYANESEVVVRDTSTGLTNLNGLYINLLEPDEFGIVKSVGAIYEDQYTLEVEEGQFILRFPTVEPTADRPLRYEINYFMDRTTEDYTNSFKAFTVSAWEKEETGGSGTGTTPEGPEEDDNKCPDVKDLEDRIKELEEENEDLKNKIKDLEDNPKVIEKEIIKEVVKEVPVEVIKEIPVEVIVEKEVPRYITELIIKEIEKEVPIYITELQIKEIEKEVIKYLDREVIKYIDREIIIEKPCKCEKEEVVLPPVEKPEEEVGGVLEEKPVEKEENTVEENTVEKDLEEDKEIHEEKPKEKPEEKFEEKEEIEEEKENPEEEEKPKEKEPVEETQARLPNTGSKVGLQEIGALILILGVILITVKVGDE